MRPASLELSLELLKQLERILARPTSTQALTFRACCVLMVATGTPIRAAARELCCQPATVRKWCRRVQARGLAGLEDARRSGRPRRITPAERCSVIAAACQAPADYGLAGYTQWSASLLAGALARSGRVASISARTVQRILQLASLKPHRCEYWKRRTDPHFDAKARPILDLYLHPPADGPVVCADEKTSIQALQRSFPDLLPRRPGERIRREAEYIRHGTRCLTAALFVHTGRVLGMVTPRRPKEVFVSFLDLLHAQVPAGGSFTWWSTT